MQLGQIANEFLLPEMEAQKIICELIRAGRVNMVVDIEGGIVLNRESRRRWIGQPCCFNLWGAEERRGTEKVIVK